MENRMYHPRPQFIRENWLSLDGEWQFSFDDENKGLSEKWFNGFRSDINIVVPFTYETELSGINQTEHHNIIWYQKRIQLSQDKNYVINFEGVDYFSQIWLNGNMIGSHTGGYERFNFDLTPYIQEGENLLTVRVTDSVSCEQPRGKQRWLKNNFGCWYVQTTGIWTSVWIEEASTIRLDHVKITPDIDRDLVEIMPSFIGIDQLEDIGNYSLQTELTFEGSPVTFSTNLLTHQSAPIILDTRLQDDESWGTKLWTQETPNLYDLKFTLFDQNKQIVDEIYSYFGMRKVSIHKGQVLLNNKQIYQRLMLDQGYWKESGLTPPSVEHLAEDIDRMLEMGYNGLRKHQKIEDERFFYLCDKKGLLTWVEMPSTYHYTDKAVRNLTDEWLQIVENHYNHPSVICWVPFNESWGVKNIEFSTHQQQFTEGVYHLTKSYDSMRPVITNDGWVHTISDILTLHDYEEYKQFFIQRYSDKEAVVNDELQFNKDFYAFANGYEYKGQPVIISEFGGIAFSSETGWGYGNQVKSEEEFLQRFDDIHQAIQGLPYVSGYCYTQLTDVEQEVNGLLNVDRSPKVDLNKIREINLRKSKTEYGAKS